MISVSTAEESSLIAILSVPKAYGVVVVYTINVPTMEKPSLTVILPVPKAYGGVVVI